jgi:hypothetical protein
MSMWHSEIAQLCKEYTGRVSIQKERVNKGGYIYGGVYFGVGKPLYFAQDEDGLWGDYFRASDRNEAIAIMRERYPIAQIKRSR